MDIEDYRKPPEDTDTVCTGWSVTIYSETEVAKNKYGVKKSHKSYFDNLDDLKKDVAVGEEPYENFWNYSDDDERELIAEFDEKINAWNGQYPLIIIGRDTPHCWGGPVRVELLPKRWIAVNCWKTYSVKK